MSWTDDGMETTRRGFLRALGLSAASLAACQRLPVEHALPYLVAPEGIVPGVPLHYAGTCTACNAGCGLISKVLDGRPIKLEGNPDHPLSRGGLCAIGQAQLRSLYDPGRLQAPLLRGQETSWEQLDLWVRDGLAGADGTVWVVSGTVTSPAARRAVQAFLQATGGRWLEHDLDPQSPSALRDAYEQLTGVPVTPAYRLENVDCLVSLAADLLATGPDPVVQTSAWAARRRASHERGPMRHLQIEGSLSLTGANADERWSANAAQRRHLALWLLRSIAEGVPTELGAAVATALAHVRPPENRVDALHELTQRLLAQPGTSLLVSAADAVDEQLAVALANRLLGNEETTLSLRTGSGLRRGRDSQLGAFLQELTSGAVRAVVIVGVDIAGQLPETAGIAEALLRVPTSVGIFRRSCATSASCTAVVAAHHGLEGWHDATPRAGLTTLAQPAVRPLFDTRHPYESFLRWSDATPGDWREHVRAGWTRTPNWDEAVRTAGLDADTAAAAAAEGIVGQTAADLPAACVTLLQATPAAATASGAMEVELVTSVSGRGLEHAANTWLRELPDPLTRVSWSPCVRVAPERARQLGIEDGDELEITVGAATVRLPAIILPGQHPDVLAVPLGHGDGSASPDCDARGDAVARLIALDQDGHLSFTGLEATAVATGARQQLPRMQIALTAQERSIVHQVDSYDAAVHAPHHPDADLWPAPAVTSPHWEMVIDLDACIGCGGCVIACQAENNIPVVGPARIAEQRDMYWLRIDRYFDGDGESPGVLFEPMLCAQCDHAPCETVCPVAATVHSEDGLNQQVYNRCVGTRYCANNCPYKVRRFNWFNFQPTDPVERLVLNPDVVVRSRGVMEKCTFCVQRIQSARIASRRDGVAFEVQTACQQSCPAQAIRFGDGAAQEGELAAARRQGRAFQVLAELGVKPSITYLSRVRSRATLAGGLGIEHEAPAQSHGGSA